MPRGSHLAAAESRRCLPRMSSHSSASSPRRSDGRETKMAVQRFEVKVPEATITDLRERLSRTRLSEADDSASWDAGTSPRYLRGLLRHWQTKFDWRQHEENINRFSHFRVAID